MIQNIVKTFDAGQVEDGELEDYLNDCGKEEFRLHTCEIMASGRILVIAERYIEITEEKIDLNEQTTPSGMAIEG